MKRFTFASGPRPVGMCNRLNTCALHRFNGRRVALHQTKQDRPKNGPHLSPSLRVRADTCSRSNCGHTQTRNTALPTTTGPAQNTIGLITKSQTARTKKAGQKEQRTHIAEKVRTLLQDSWAPWQALRASAQGETLRSSARSSLTLIRHLCSL